MLWVRGRQDQGQGPRRGPRHVAVDGTQRETSHNSGSCAGPKVLGPDAIRRQAWSRGDARYVSRHGLRGNTKGGSGGHK